MEGIVPPAAAAAKHINPEKNPSRESKYSESFERLPGQPISERGETANV